MRDNAAISAPPSVGERCCSDPAEFAESALASLLALACSTEDARRRLGLKGASRRADGWPAWCVWLAGVAGAYELALAPPAAADGGGDTPVAIFALRYFPHPDEAAFEDFAPAERACRLSALFDRTGTPALDAWELIDPSLFHVATLFLSPAPDGLDIALAAQERWLETETTAGAPHSRRSVRGFDLAAPLLDFLVCAHGCFGRRPPRAIEIVSEPGVCWLIDDGGAARPQRSPGCPLFTVHALGLPRFGFADPAGETPAAPAVRLAAGQSRLLRDDGRAPPPTFGPLNLAAWREAAQWRLAPSGLFCGCHARDLSRIVGADESDDSADGAIGRGAEARP